MQITLDLTEGIVRKMRALHALTGDNLGDFNEYLLDKIDQILDSEITGALANQSRQANQLRDEHRLAHARYAELSVPDPQNRAAILRSLDRGGPVHRVEPRHIEERHADQRSSGYDNPFAIADGLSGEDLPGEEDDASESMSALFGSPAPAVVEPKEKPEPRKSTPRPRAKPAAKQPTARKPAASSGGLTLETLARDNEVADPNTEAISPDGDETTFGDLFGLTAEKSYEEAALPPVSELSVQDLASPPPRTNVKKLPNHVKARVEEFTGVESNSF